MEKEEIGKRILRISMGLVFLYFGYQQVINTSDWTGYVPGFLTQYLLTSNNIVMINALLELILGFFMIIGLYTRTSSLILSIHLLLIAFSQGYTPIGIKDFGLSLATLVVSFNQPDDYCLDSKLLNKNIK